MKRFFCLMLLAAPVAAAPWTDQLTPWQRQQIGPMLKRDWSPAREVELTPQERKEWQHLLDQFNLRVAPGATLPQAPVQAPQQQPTAPSSDAPTP